MVCFISRADNRDLYSNYELRTNERTNERTNQPTNQQTNKQFMSKLRAKLDQGNNIEDSKMNLMTMSSSIGLEIRAV